jgi:TolB-like protein
METAMKPHLTGLLGLALLLGWSLPMHAQEQVANDRPDNGRERVLLLPFEQIDPDPQHAWVTQAMLRSLSAELAQERAVRPVILPAEQVRDLDLQDEQAVLQLARENDAHYAVLGSYQVVEPNVRFTGQLLDVESGEPIGGLKATGLVRDLFSLQDTLASQTRRQIPGIESARRPMQDELVLEHPAPPAIDPLGPVRMADERRRYFNGSGLERAVRDDIPRDRYYYEPAVYPAYPPGPAVYPYSYPYPYYYPPVVIPYRVFPVVYPSKVIGPPPPKSAPSIMRHTMSGVRHTGDRRHFHNPTPNPPPSHPPANPGGSRPGLQPLPPRN